MITLLYDLDTQTAGPQRLGRYIVDGQTGIFPSNYVELEFKEPDLPIFDSATQKIEFSNYYANLTDFLWTRDVNVLQKTLDDIKKDQEEQREAEFQASINAGYLIPETQIYLGITNKDRQAWNELLALINELLNLGRLQLTSSLKITDKDGNVHEFTVSQVKEILAGLGLYYYSIWIKRNTIV